MTDKSTVVRKLTVNEISSLKKELIVSDHLWNHHLPVNKKFLTALKDGRSIHLRYDRLKDIDTNQWNKFPHSVEIINEIANGQSVERTFWHRLLPGEVINRHHDKNVHYVKDGKIFARYQIYLDIPTDSYIFMDDSLVEDASVFSNSVINFNLRKYHEYRNNSNDPWYFLVFDVMKD
jgi:hypothetical protein